MSDLVEKVARAIDSERQKTWHFHEDRLAIVAIAAVYDDLESSFPLNASLGGAIRTKRRELGL